jgi:hypothetical protein
VDMPEPLGKDVDVRVLCDSDHAGDKRTRCSCTGFLIFCNMAFTLSCPLWHLCGILTLAIYISPNNGPLDLLLGKKMILHVMAIISLLGSKSIRKLLMKLQYL